MPRHANSTSFRAGQTGNPRGRTLGTQNRRTIEVREMCNRIVDDDEYRDALKRRMITGTAGAMEPLVWAYAKGKPVERIESGGPGAFSELTNDELKARLIAAIATFPPE